MLECLYVILDVSKSVHIVKMCEIICLKINSRQREYRNSMIEKNSKGMTNSGPQLNFKKNVQLKILTFIQINNAACKPFFLVIVAILGSHRPPKVMSWSLPLQRAAI